MDSPVIFDHLAESTTPHIKKTRLLGVEVATTESHLQETTAIFGYHSLFLLHHFNGFEFSVVHELSMSTRYDRTSCLTAITICSLANSRHLNSALLLSLFLCASRVSIQENLSPLVGAHSSYVVQHPLYSSCYGMGYSSCIQCNKHPPHLSISTLSAHLMAQCTLYTAKTWDVECL